jgi:hypothetical protein
MVLNKVASIKNEMIIARKYYYDESRLFKRYN